MLSDEELHKKYGQFCGYMAWVFVRRSQSTAKYSEQITSTLGTEDAEDLASQALIGLLKCPVAHRHEPPYVKRLIINAIIKAWRKRLKQVENELQPPNTADAETTDYFDSLQGRDGLAGYTALKYDSQTVLKLLPSLPETERIVIELSFGLNGCNPCGLERIAKKLGRTKYWADARLQKGLSRVRESIGIKWQAEADTEREQDARLTQSVAYSSHQTQL